MKGTLMATSPDLSRRRFMKLGLAGLTSVGLLAACAPQAPAPAATSVPAAAPAKSAEVAKPAEAAKPAAPAAAAPAKPAEAAKPAVAARPAGQPKSGGILRVGQVGDVATLDGTFTPGVAEIAWAIHDRLTAYDEQLQPHPM